VTQFWNPTGILRQARQRDSLVKRQRVLTTLEQMARNKEPITFAAVARAASVSTWLVYAEGIREHIEATRQRQANQRVPDQRAGLSPSAASLHTDLQLARHEIKQLRADRDKLRQNLQKQLGRQLDAFTHGELIARIEELTQHNQRLTDQNCQLAAANEQLHSRAGELEDDLTATRTSLRRMIRNTNQPRETP
jgi:chromosome segregation ATPase